MISEPELELSMSSSNRYQSHSEGSDRHLNEPVQAEGLGNVATNTARSYELLPRPQNVPQRGHSEILQWMESTIIQTSNQKEGGNQGRSPKPTHFPKNGRRTRKRTGENHILQVTGFQKSKKMAYTM
ncbi:hypothetical protein O181_120750 [Austropuccinia psidii MF-1]|uniref:Uncharacterized protein n=1 Tax=Austropuccinia psidii MF-1 TaxID=1389203 RepID=A0A9Q3KKT9_9BASI|nr:hypothetical protein [Austropuccinia psidii MF-1]